MTTRLIASPVGTVEATPRSAWETMNDYADAKHEFIAEVLDRAEVWAERTGWRP